MPARIHSPERVIQGLAEVFREHGFEGASLAHITKATGLGKGSLYHAFPGGKDEMAAAVLADIDAWFELNVFTLLDDPETPAAKAIDHMLDACAEYFQCGGRVCLVGVFALSDTRDSFAEAVNGYFRRWAEALVEALRRSGLSRTQAQSAAEDVLAGIQGGLVIARAFDDNSYFERELKRLRDRLKMT
ncbi:TetR/AcrR family transcriptional regulator [Magnetovibrio sp.]|uniref:TetR/AcrR family transcriptional regulator n=1 Tax=Magnetovibrio sp. TaxID=2024836 RepID=UPI002F926FAC